MTISRRRFLAGSAATLALGSLGGAAQGQLPPPLPRGGQWDVIVIGGGMAGITAAKRLALYGRSVLVIESMDRFGGRLFTRQFAGIRMDYGGAWIHSGNDNPLYGIALEMGFDLVHQDDTLIAGAYLDGKPLPDLASLPLVQTQIVQSIQSAGRSMDVAASVVTQVRTPAQQVASTFIGPMDAGVDFSELSTADYAGFAAPEPNFLIRQGFGTFAEAYASHRLRYPIDMIKGNPVIAVDYSGKDCYVVTEANDYYKARAVLVTVSTGVLQASKINFVPAFSARKREAIQSIKMGLLNKIFISVADRSQIPLPANSNVVLESSYGNDDFYFLAYPFDTNILIGFVGGSYAKEFETYSLEKQKQKVTAVLNQTFGPLPNAFIQDIQTTRWWSNPHTFGSYSAALPGLASARLALAEPVNDKIFFAGEAMAGSLSQTAGGAFRSGTIAADAIHTTLPS